MVRLRPGRGKSGRPGLLWRWTTYHESFLPEFFFIPKIWAQVGESFSLNLGLPFTQNKRIRITGGQTAQEVE